MKSLIVHPIIGFVLLIILSLTLMLDAKGQTVKARIAVAGNCDLCKERIEAGLDIKGIRFAKYNPETHWLEVQYTSKSFTMDDIEKKIALLGHDTPNHKAADSTYEQLHGCCKYQRPFPFPKESQSVPSTPLNR